MNKKSFTRRMLAGFCLATMFVNSGLAQGERKDRMTPFYLMPQVNVNYSDNENTHLLLWKKAVAEGAALTMGKEFSPLWGWRASLGYNRNKSYSIWNNETERYVISFRDVELFADLTFDFTDLVLPNRKNRRWNVMLFGGVGGAKSFDFGDRPLAEDGDYTTSPKPVLGLRGGVNVAYKVSNHVALSLEGTGYMFQDRFNGVNEARMMDARSSLAAGIVFYLGGSKTGNVVPMVPIVPAEVQPVETLQVPELEILLAYIVPDVAVKQRRTEGCRANLEYPVNLTTLYPDFRNNTEELNKIRASIDKVKNDPDLIISSLVLHGFASPEGGYPNNERLAEGRVHSLSVLLMKEYGFEKNMFVAESTPEDWAGFKTMVEASDLKDKQALLDIINDDTLDPDAKERKLRRMKQTFRYVLHEFFPSLRHTDYAIEYVIRPFDVEEARERMNTHPERLSLDEMYRVACSYEKKSEDFRKVMDIIMKYYPDSSVANLNAACAALENKDVTSARKYLTHVADCPQKTHALAVVELLKGTREAAVQLFKQAAEQGLAESQEMLKRMER